MPKKTKEELGAEFADELSQVVAAYYQIVPVAKRSWDGFTSFAAASVDAMKQG